MPERKCVAEGTCYPTNHVGAVIDNRADAEAAAEALQRAGFADVHQFHGAEAFVAIQAASRHENALVRTWRRVREFSDEGEVQKIFLSALYRGGSVLITYAATDQHAQQVSDILSRHHAHDVWYLGALTVEHLPQWLAGTESASAAHP